MEEEEEAEEPALAPPPPPLLPFMSASAAPVNVPTQSARMRAPKSVSAVGHVRLSAAMRIETPVEKKKMARSGGRQLWRREVISVRLLSRLHTVKPVTMHASIGSRRRQASSSQTPPVR